MRSGFLALLISSTVQGKSGTSRSSALIWSRSRPWGGSLKSWNFIVITWMSHSSIAVIFPECLSFPSKKRLKGFSEVCLWHMQCVRLYNLPVPYSLLWLCLGSTAGWHCARYCYCYMPFLFPGSQVERKHEACHYSRGAEAWLGCKLLAFVPVLLLPITCRWAWSGRALLVVTGLGWSWSMVVRSSAGMGSSVTSARSAADGSDLLTNMLWNANDLSHCWMVDKRQMVLMKQLAAASRW